MERKGGEASGRGGAKLEATDVGRVCACYAHQANGNSRLNRTTKIGIIRVRIPAKSSGAAAQRRCKKLS
eukprot:122868-Pelagomonas_calceolata.AAC.4